MKAEIIRKQPLENVQDIVAMEVIKGMMYLLSHSGKKLICLDPYLNSKFQLDLPGFGAQNSNCTITSFAINGYPHLMIIEHQINQNQLSGWLVKLPTPYNRKPLIWQKDLSDWYSLFEMHEEFAVQQPAIKTAIAGSDYFALISEGKNYSTILYFNKEESIEYFQNHTESAPFPQLDKLEFTNDQNDHLTLIDNLVYNDVWFGLSNNAENKSFIHYRHSTSFEQIRGLETKPLALTGQQLMVTEGSEQFTGQITCLGITENPEPGIYMAVAIEQLGAQTYIQLIEINLN